MRSRLAVENHRGVMVPRTLGLWLAVAATASTILVAGTQPDGPVERAGWGVLAATLLVFAAGMVDDLVGSEPRGVRNHARALATGHLSTGLLKVVVVVGAASVAVTLQPARSGAVRLAGVVLVAGCANVWNGLDVRPGRALRFALIAMVGLVGIDLALLPTLPLVAVASATLLWAVTRERAMLGDGGANVLGCTIGLGLYVVLPGWAVVAGAVVAVALNVVAETITFSRAIDAIAPLRWFDRLGRLQDGET
jgi:UDP-GlcNAc:undecaprenyl-phosphate GlcNAc-1-phosphate transferase